MPSASVGIPALVLLAIQVSGVMAPEEFVTSILIQEVLCHLLGVRDVD